LDCDVQTSGTSARSPDLPPRSAGRAVGTAIVATILAAHTAHDGLPAEHGWVVAFIALAIVAAIGVATCLLIPGGTPRRERNAQARREAEK
jgi:hypothetical protein